MLNACDYQKTINEKIFSELISYAAVIADKLLKKGIRGDVPIREVEATREVAIPYKILGFTVGSKRKTERYFKVTLSGWKLGSTRF